MILSTHNTCICFHGEIVQKLRGMDTFMGGSSVKIDFSPFQKGSTLKGKNLLPFPFGVGANSFLLE